MKYLMYIGDYYKLKNLHTMRFSIVLLLGALLFGICTPNVSYAVANNASTSISAESNKEIKKAEKRQKKIDKKLDRFSKFITKKLGISETKYKALSNGLKVTLIVIGCIVTLLLIALLIYLLVIKPIIK